MKVILETFFITVIFVHNLEIKKSHLTIFNWHFRYQIGQSEWVIVV